jgi:YegS/Rv2252/BmrU family lipid kinase
MFNMFVSPYLIINPKAGPYLKRRQIPRLIQFIKGFYPGLKVLETQRPGDGTRFAREAVQAGADLILCAGGDGTYHEVINGMAGSVIPLGVLPMGTGNSLVRELGLSTNPFKAVRALQTGRSQYIYLAQVQPSDTAKTDRRYFVLMAGAGFDAYVVGQVGTGFKKFLGKLAYLLTGTASLFTYPFPTITFQIGDKRLTGTTGITAKARTYAGPFTIAPPADLSKPTLVLCLFKGRGPLAYLKYAIAVMLGLHTRLKDVEMHMAEKVTVTAPFGTDRPVTVQVDGEALGPLPVTLSIAEEGLWLLTPASSARKP